MSVVIIRQDGKIDSWKAVLQRLAPDVHFYSYLEEHPREEVEVAMVWKHPPGIFKQYPSLKYVASFGAGVDFLMDDPDLPTSLPVTRVVDPILASDMSEFVIGAILAYLKNLHQYGSDQIRSSWKPLPYKRIRDVTVGIMGMGELGKALSKDLIALNFKVSGWSTSRKSLEGISSFAGTNERSEFLAQTDVLICLLPLTPNTQGILNKELFGQLPRGAYIINVARGGHLVDEDLLEMLDNGHLGGACLDVFHKEPLVSDHPFWRHPKVFITPHVASVSDADAVAPQLIENYRRFKEGQPLLYQVSTTDGY